MAEQVAFYQNPGHDTHGLALLGAYLKKIDQRILAVTGSYKTISEKPAAQLWDGCFLPGPWLTARAVAEASAMARSVVAAEDANFCLHKGIDFEALRTAWADGANIFWCQQFTLLYRLHDIKGAAKGSIGAADAVTVMGGRSDCRCCGAALPDHGGELIRF